MKTNYIKAKDAGALSFQHDGVEGMKWGRRRYQNKDGTWTAEGLARRREQYQDTNGDDGWTVSGKGRDPVGKTKTYTPPKSSVYVHVSGKDTKSKEVREAEARAKAAEKKAEKDSRAAQKTIEKANKELEKANAARDKAVKEAEEARNKTAQLIKDMENRESAKKRQEQKDAKKEASEKKKEERKTSKEEKAKEDKKEAERIRILEEKRAEKAYQSELNKRKAAEQALRSTVSTIDSTNNLLGVWDRRERRKIAQSLDLSSLSTEEMNQIINRLNTEQRYMDAVASRHPSKHERTREFLETASGVVTIGVGLAGIASAIYQIRHGK